VEVCDHLLAKGQGIVSQRGRASLTRLHGYARQRRPYLPHRRAGQPRLGIGCGDRRRALQDHDRALIVGETTFGKGLVQTVYDLGDHSMALALTTYHYYTPSAASSSATTPASRSNDYYTHGGTQPADNANREVKLTDSGRTVYGGGGITPDEKIESPKSNHFRTRS